MSALRSRARGITKRFGEVIALDGVDLEVPRGQIHGLAGPNGAGKTTLLGLLLGLATADRGRLDILGMPVGRALSAPEGVAGFVDGPGLYPSLTARQNLTALTALRGGGSRTAAVDDVLDEVGLTDVADDRIRGFSLGMRQRINLAAALLTRPPAMWTATAHPSRSSVPTPSAVPSTATTTRGSRWSAPSSRSSASTR